MRWPVRALSAISDGAAGVDDASVGAVGPVRQASSAAATVLHRHLGIRRERRSGTLLRRQVRPHHFTGRRIERRRGVDAGGRIEQTADHQRRAFEVDRHGDRAQAAPRLERRHRLPPRDAQVPDVVLVDLIGGRILVAGVARRVGAPLDGGRRRAILRAHRTAMR